MRIARIALAALTVIACSEAGAQEMVNKIPAPTGYTRVATEAGSFSRFVQTLELRGDSKTIHTWKGEELNQGFHVLGVAKLPLLYKQDLEQCADWAMRLWAEHHKEAGTLERLTLFNYDGSKKAYRGSGESYEKFLRLRMAYSNSHSLKKGALPVNEPDIRPGDLVVQNETGGIGHVSVILDKATAPNKPPLYLIGFSFMPAQEFHIEEASAMHGVSGWFTLDGFRRYLKDRLDLGEPVLRRFPE
ncbi:MAG: DUF4846 domain-containing protein [Verrucomicrobiales bacterium]